jgi:hypothetical protein
MKLKDIKEGHVVAARVRRWSQSTPEIQKCSVHGVDGRYVDLYVPEWDEKRRVYFTQVESVWATYEAATAKAEAKAAKQRQRETAAWEAKRAEERQRFEEHILPAFKGLPAPAHMPPGRNADLAEYIADMMLDGGSSTVQFREADLRAIADRIAELSAIVTQSALTAQDVPEAGWGYEPQPEPTPAENAELEAELRRDGGADEPRQVIDIPFERLGLDVKDGDA